MKAKRVLIITLVIGMLITAAITLVSCTNNNQEQYIGEGDSDIAFLESSAGFEITEDQAKYLYELHLAEDLRMVLLNSLEIEDATVVLNIGETSLEGDPSSSRDPTASVILTPKENSTLSDQVIQAVADLIRNTVPGISYEDITITDSDLNAYAISD